MFVTVVEKGSATAFASTATVMCATPQELTSVMIASEPTTVVGVAVDAAVQHISYVMSS